MDNAQQVAEGWDMDGDGLVLLASLFAVVAAPLAVVVARAVDWVASARAVSQVTRAGAVWTPEAIQGVLRATLRDPTLRLEMDAEPAEPAEPGRTTLALRSPLGDPVAVVHLDSRAAAHTRRVRAVLRAARPGLEHAKLLQTSRVQLERLRESRRLIAATALAERQRMERDLHDGAQQSLLATSMRVETTRLRSTDPVVTDALASIRDELRAAHRELREVVGNVYPAVLDTAGVAAALEVLAETLPFVLVVDVQAEDVEHIAQVVGYFAVADLLATVRPGGDRDCVTTVEGQRRGDLFHLTVSGGLGVAAVPAAATRRISDRLHALGGNLDVSLPDHVVTMEIPCE